MSYRIQKVGVFGIFVLASIYSSPALSFECTRSTKYDFVSLRWDGLNPIPYATQKNEVQKISPELLQSALEFGFSAWSEPSCSSLRFEYKGEVEVDTPLSDMNQIITISDDWPEGTIDAVGLTTMTYNSLNGVIKYGKIEINESTFQFVDVLENNCSFSSEYDLHSVLTHEIGHFIGLAHLSLEDAQSRLDLGEDPASMSRQVEPCDFQFRSLEADDLEGACYMYPAGQNSRNCATLPSQESSFILNDSFSCQSHSWATPQDSNSSLYVLALGLLGLALRRRKKGQG